MTNREQNVETTLLVLFDAHQRIAEQKIDSLADHDTTEDRGLVMESFDKALTEIKLTAVDYTLKEMDGLIEYAD